MALRRGLFGRRSHEDYALIGRAEVRGYAAIAVNSEYSLALPSVLSPHLLATYFMGTYASLTTRTMMRADGEFSLDMSLLRFCKGSL
jgi:hypothetical protein